MSFPYDQLNTNTDALLIAANYYPRFQQMLKEEDIVVVETGTFYYGMAEVRLPSDVVYIGQGGWQSIGYATPRRSVLLWLCLNAECFCLQGWSLTTDSSRNQHHALLWMQAYNFVLNNDGYTIEKYLNVKQKSKVQQKFLNGLILS